RPVPRPAHPADGRAAARHRHPAALLAVPQPGRAALGQDVTVWTLGRGGDTAFYRTVDPAVRVRVVPFPDRARGERGRAGAAVDRGAAGGVRRRAVRHRARPGPHQRERGGARCSPPRPASPPPSTTWPANSTPPSPSPTRSATAP